MCDCIRKINEDLANNHASRNTQILTPILAMQTGIAGIVAFVETCKLDESKRGKPASMQATYCPFCGTKYVIQQ